jgi:hypothetical protein
MTNRFKDTIPATGVATAHTCGRLFLATVLYGKLAPAPDGVEGEYVVWEDPEGNVFGAAIEQDLIFVIKSAFVGVAKPRQKGQRPQGLVRDAEGEGLTYIIPPEYSPRDLRVRL